ncbi:MAG: PDZ domain-containing protein [Gammaproteobacteria bacterium]|nr:PDZ domain-containing protein [Gammaproteobacteria bacterium]
MNYSRVQFGSLFVLSLIAIGSFASGVPALTGPKTIAPLIEAVTPSVVNISATKPSSDDEIVRNRYRSGERTAIGSGVIIDADKGYIVTNEHVIRDATELRVSLNDGTTFNATIVGEDRYSDVALLAIEAENLKALTLADSDKTRVGDFVVAIGNPFRLQHSVTSGIVSALGRKNLDIEEVEDFIQTDASINQGNSGGPLINFYGEVIGINTAIIGGASGSVGIGFAIPSNLVKESIEQLIEFGSVSRGYLGVEMEDFDAATYARMYGLDDFDGVRINSVDIGSAAEESGIQDYDVIVSFDGEPIKATYELANRIRRAKLGASVPIELFREGKKLTVYTEIRPLYSEQKFSFSGATLFGDSTWIPRVPTDDVPFWRNGSSRYYHGAVHNVTRVEPDSEAEKLGIKVYDQIIKSEVYSDIEGNQIIAVDVLRDEQERLRLTLRKDNSESQTD